MSCYILVRIVELFPVGLTIGTTLRAAGANCAGPHSTPRSTNKFVEALLMGVFADPDGQDRKSVV